MNHMLIRSNVLLSKLVPVRSTIKHHIQFYSSSDPDYGKRVKEKMEKELQSRLETKQIQLQLKYVYIYIYICNKISSSERYMNCAR